MVLYSHGFLRKRLLVIGYRLLGRRKDWKHKLGFSAEKTEQMLGEVISCCIFARIFTENPMYQVGFLRKIRCRKSDFTRNSATKQL